jgi:hypothetical protein
VSNKFAEQEVLFAPGSRLRVVEVHAKAPPFMANHSDPRWKNSTHIWLVCDEV